MSKTKMRIWLLFFIVAAIFVGVYYYIYYVKKDTTVTEGTLVENVEKSMEEQCGKRNSLYQNRS